MCAFDMKSKSVFVLTVHSTHPENEKHTYQMYVRIDKGNVAKSCNILYADNAFHFLHRNKENQHVCRHPVSYLDGFAELTIGNAPSIELHKNGQSEIGCGNLGCLYVFENHEKPS